MYFVYDYGILIITLIITLCAQALVSSSYSKYKKIKNKKSITGAEAARIILSKNGPLKKIFTKKEMPNS